MFFKERMKQTTNTLILHRNVLMMYQCMKQLLNEAEYDMKNYADRGECYLPDIRLQDLYTTSHHTKSEFNNFFIIHSKYF